MTKGSLKKVLLIDDSDIDLFIQKRFLEVYGFSTQLEMYNSANEAFRALKNADSESAPDAIFLDLNMPGADGFSFLKNFSLLPDSVTRKSRIVILTSSESNIDRDYVLSFHHVIHFITKPLKNSDIEDLKAIF
jgi:Response regulator containing CheY-like receiver, AAA-type ATPase, and DNA-binding domains